MMTCFGGKEGGSQAKRREGREGGGRTLREKGKEGGTMDYIAREATREGEQAVRTSRGRDEERDVQRDDEEREGTRTTTRQGWNEVSIGLRSGRYGSTDFGE